MDLKKKLTQKQFQVTQFGTELPFTGKYVNHHKNGKYTCICCNQVLFSADTKFNPALGFKSHKNS